MRTLYISWLIGSTAQDRNLDIWPKQIIIWKPWECSWQNLCKYKRLLKQLNKIYRDLNSERVQKQKQIY